LKFTCGACPRRDVILGADPKPTVKPWPFARVMAFWKAIVIPVPAKLASDCWNAIVRPSAAKPLEAAANETVKPLPANPGVVVWASAAEVMGGNIPAIVARMATERNFAIPYLLCLKVSSLQKTASTITVPVAEGELDAPCPV